MGFSSELFKLLSVIGLSFPDNSGFAKLGISYTVTNKRPFSSDGVFSKEDVKKAFDFAKQMSLNQLHRPTRSGGTYNRDYFDILKNTFQGKLSEFAIYHLFDGIANVNEPDLSIYSRGIWDSGDFEINGNRVAIKSAKSFAQLLLLETKDWDENGIYIPDINKSNGGIYDYFILVRIDPNIDDCYTENDIINISWQYQITGYITREDLISVIKSEHIIPKDAKLNGKIPMDAENYYVQSGDLKDINKLIKEVLK